MESVLCFHCGGDVPTDQQWCGYCAAPVVAVGPPAPAAPLPGPAPTRTSGSSSVRPPRAAPIIATAAVLILVAAVVALGVARFAGDSPESVAGDYLDALADGDAGAALDLVAGAGTFRDAQRYPLLTGAALAEDRYRPRDAHVGDATESDLMTGGKAWQIPVTYRAADRTVSQDLTVVDATEGYRLQSPLVLLGVDGERGRAVTVNGVALGSRDAYVFPGAYEVVATGNRLLAESRVTAVPQRAQVPVTGQTVYLAGARFDLPRLAAGAQEDIQGQVRTALDRCAGSALAQPAGCPFGLNIPGTGATVRWTITGYPAVSVRSDSTFWFNSSSVQLADDGAGKVHWSVGYTDYRGTAKSESGDSAFRINGSAQATPNGIQISLV
ncbi:hypothetical protein GCM10010168_89160 [Actinoplanes ianthinogenes]|uniref:Zinc ribbon domain-containing protein n=1 Tax=Actinoplanes ianthinogenes TaxID=122358 RepID=A0ABM7LQ28_9ACTN|nr:hypothetical protein [Actinoplanes ianthinogenes]BCJ41324.1 hypothetical protein Aiant_19810 [Actinoplanes ianthinogenes]GGR56396.1 hypothetical protein GCM10010168_89160 [Actinoplanes ianthinogenes]